MKAIINNIATALLCCAFLCPNLAIAKDNKVKLKQEAEQESILVVVLVLTCIAAGGCAILYVHAKMDKYNAEVTLVLEKSRDQKNWWIVKTNTVHLDGRKDIEVFREEIESDEMAFYRTFRIPNPTP